MIGETEQVQAGDGPRHALQLIDGIELNKGRIVLKTLLSGKKGDVRETSGKASGRVYVANTPRTEGSSPDVLHTLPYQWLFVACGRRGTHWHQSGALPSPLDAAQRSPAAEPRRCHPWSHGLWSRCSGGAACLGRARVWVLAHSAAPGRLAAGGPGRRPLAGPPAWGLPPGRSEERRVGKEC